MRLREMNVLQGITFSNFYGQIYRSRKDISNQWHRAAMEHNKVM